MTRHTSDHGDAFQYVAMALIALIVYGTIGFMALCLAARRWPAVGAFLERILS